MQILLRFAAARGASPIDAARLFYHVGLKPALVFRGWQRFEPQKILSFAARGPGGRKLTVHARDNSLDVGTFEEFFSSRYTIIPHGLPLLEPKVIYDIGANIGVASLYFACRYPGARLFGFEPVPDNFEVCQRNYANLINSGVFPSPLALEPNAVSSNSISRISAGRSRPRLVQPRQAQKNRSRFRSIASPTSSMKRSCHRRTSLRSTLKAPKWGP